MKKVFFLLSLVFVLNAFSYEEEKSKLLDKIRLETAMQEEELSLEKKDIYLRKKKVEESLASLKKENKLKKQELERLISETERIKNINIEAKSLGRELKTDLKESEESFLSLLSGSYLFLNTEKKEDKRDLDLKSYFQRIYRYLDFCDFFSFESLFFTAADGSRKKGDFLRTGPFLSFGRDKEGRLLFLEKNLDASSYKELDLRLSWMEKRRLKKLLEDKDGDFPFFLGSFLTKSSFKDSFFKSLREGGFFLWPIIFTGLSGLIIFLFRAFVLFGYPSCSRETALILEEIKAGGNKGSKDKKSPVFDILFLAVSLISEPREKRNKALESALLKLSDNLERGLSSLALMAAISPMLGLLGTLTGMMSSFGIMGSLGSSDIKFISGGIAEALITTQWGLFSAVFLLLAHHILSLKAEKLALEAEDRLIEALAIIDGEED